MSSAEREIARLVRSTALGPDELRETFVHFLWTGEGHGFPESAHHDPHALGWLQQYLAESARKQCFEAHTAREAKHGSQTSTTQVYTPRWVADWLFEACVSASGVPDTVLDPACGGGQMLLAAADGLIARGQPASEVFSRLRGVDLDPDAVWACRESLKLAAWRAAGRRDENVESGIDRNVKVDDGLFGALEAADIVITNPPYMGSRSMTPELKASLKLFAPFHHDLYLAFIKRCAQLTTGSIGVLAQQTLWYLKRFESARAALLRAGRLTHFAHLGHGVFDGLSGEKATVVAFTWLAGDTGGTAQFWDLRNAPDKAAGLDSAPRVLEPARFEALPAAPLAFWLPSQLIDAFAGPRVSSVAEVPGSQNKTGDNSKYVKPLADAPEGWVPYSKGGKFAPWWGNWDWAVDWSAHAREFYASNATSNLLDERYWFREGLCYSDFGGRHFNARWMPPGCVFDMAGPAIFVHDDDGDLLAALLVVLNSTVAREILNALNPTLHFQVRDVRNLPLPRWDDRTVARLAAVGHELVDATRHALGSDEPAPVEQEFAADQLVAEAYGCPDRVISVDERRRHHRLRSR